MVSKPSILPEWAENDVVDPISGQNNVLEPPNEKKLEGWARLEFPPRNWFNWLGRYTYRWLNWLKQQEEQAIITDGDGVNIFPISDSLCVLYAVDMASPTHYLHAIGANVGGTLTLTIVSSATLSLGVISGTSVPITGAADPSTIIAWGQSKIIPS
jgi:hypothetical protein